MPVKKTNDRWKLVMGALVVLLGVGSCKWSTTGPRPPAEARIQVTGEGPLLIITLEAFDRITNDSTLGVTTVLYAADTVVSNLPFDSTYAVAPSDRFLVRVVNLDTVPRDMRLQVSFDGDLKYNQAATLTNASLEYNHTF